MSAPEQAAGRAEFAVDIENVCFSYASDPGVRALDGVTLRVPWGQCIVLTGSSGCGKTTVTRLVNGLIPAAYGGVLEGGVGIAGTSLTDWSADKLCRRVGSVFQNPRSQFFNLDTTSEVAFGCENLGLRRDDIRRRVDEAFRMLGIGHLKDRDIFALSGGQRQMVAIASACAMEPDILVFDEPTASLDVASMRLLARTIARLKALGKTVIVAEHRLWWLAEVADRVVVMREGRIDLDCDASSFSRLDAGELARLGLRAWNIEQTGLPPAFLGGDAGGVGLEVENLRASYRTGPEVLKGVEASVERGAIVALVGRNGGGKTTFARCLVGLHRESAGTVRFGATVPKRRARPEHAFLVMQEPGYQLFASSVRGELESALGQGGSKREPGEIDDTVDGALERFGLAHLADRHPLSLSGGQRQRLAIAAGTSQGAELLVLDEPTSGLDCENMKRVARELRLACESGTCAIVITHDFEFIETACQSVLHLSDGVIGETFPVDTSTLPRIRSILGFGG